MDFICILISTIGSLLKTYISWVMYAIYLFRLFLSSIPSSSYPFVSVYKRLQATTNVYLPDKYVVLSHLCKVNDTSGKVFL